MNLDASPPDAIWRLREMFTLLGFETTGSWHFKVAPFDFFAVGVFLHNDRSKIALGFENFDVLRILSETIKAQAKACGVEAMPLSAGEIFAVDDLLRMRQREGARTAVAAL
ncbi:hypothetical protein BOC44_20780 (plasmid) [Burkholderia pseudomallei]|nr:hypothetical protein BOC44_20780 [Burkholderia pseudomallei]